MSDSRRVDSLDEFPSESLDLYTSAPSEHLDEPAGLIAIVPAPPVADATRPDPPLRAWRRRRRFRGAPRRHLSRAFTAVAQSTGRATRQIRASIAGFATRPPREITSPQLRTYKTEGSWRDLRTDGARPRKVAEPAPGTSMARQRRRERLRRAIAEAAGRDSLVRVATVSQLTPVVARVAAASSARAGRRLRAALYRLTVQVHPLGLHARTIAITVWRVTAQAVSSFARQVVWPSTARVAAHLRGAVVWLGENRSQLIGKTPGTLRSAVVRIGEYSLQLIGLIRGTLQSGVVWFGENGPPLIGEMRGALRSAVMWLGESTSQLAGQMRGALRSAMGWLGENGPMLIRRIRDARRRAVTRLGENGPHLIGQMRGALHRAGQLLHPGSVAVAGAMLALIVIASPNRGLSDMSGAVPPTTSEAVPTATGPAVAAPKMVDVNTPRNDRTTTPTLIVARATVAELSVVKAPVAPAAVQHPRPPARIDPRAIQAVLNRYRDAVSTLDVSALRSVWPDADVSALQKEFAGVRDQNVEFEGCRISGAGSGAFASCAGVIESGFRPGDRRPRVERRRWQFTLQKSGPSWKIVEVQTQRG